MHVATGAHVSYRRVLCLAYKQLDASLTADDLRGITRDEAERGLTLAGCAVFQTPLKVGTSACLACICSCHAFVILGMNNTGRQ